MASRTRPSRLLNLNKSPKQNKAISATNAANSPYLRLPPEIRSRIHKFLLGGNVVHLARTRNLRGTLRSGAVICGAPDQMSKERSGCRVHSPTWLRELGVNAWAQCIVAVQSQQRHLPIHFLEVSRQIYHETVLVPFGENLFVLDAGGLDRFTTKMIPAQLKAITHLDMTISHQIRIQQAMRKLGGLQSLRLAITPTHNEIPHGTVDNLKNLFTSGTRGLGFLSLPNLSYARIDVTVWDVSRFIQATDAAQEPIETWLEGQETSLLGSTQAILASQTEEAGEGRGQAPGG